MIGTKENLIKWYVQNSGVPHFFVFAGKDKDTIIFSSPSENNPNYSQEAGLQHFKQIIDLLSDNTVYFIRLKPTYDCKDSSKFRQTLYTHTAENKSIGQIPHFTPPTFSNEEIEAKIAKESQKMFQQYKTELEKKELQNKIEELEKKLNEKKEENFSPLIGMLEPYLPQIIGAFMQPQKTAVTISGFETQPQPQTKFKKMSNTTAQSPKANQANHEEKLINLLSEWQSIDEQFIDVIEAVVKGAKASPKKYVTYKIMLLG